MQDIRVQMRTIADLDNQELIAGAKNLVRKEKECIVSLILHLMEISARKLFVLQGFSNLSDYCTEVLKLSKNKGWKRVQVAKVCEFHPELLGMLVRDEISVSHISLIASRLTEANKEIMLEGIRGKSIRAAEFFVSRINPDGSLKDSEATVEVRFNCPQSLVAKIDRAKEIMMGRGKGSGLVSIMEEAVNLLLEKHDPVKKAERSEARKKRQLTPPAENLAPAAAAMASREPVAAKIPATWQAPIKEPVKQKSRYIPAAIRHQTVLRDGGQCTYVSPDGRRCSEKGDIELDHRKMWCHGGEHSLGNLVVVCSMHNRWLAGERLGVEFVASKMSSATVAMSARP